MKVKRPHERRTDGHCLCYLLEWIDGVICITELVPKIIHFVGDDIERSGITILGAIAGEFVATFMEIV